MRAGEAGGAETPEPSLGPPAPRSWQLFTLAASSPAALDRLSRAVSEWLATRKESPARLASGVRRALGNGPHRIALIARDAASAAEALTQRDPDRVVTDTAVSPPPPVAFLFPGGGAQRVNMGRELYATEPVFRRVFDEGAESLVKSGGVDLRRLVFVERERAGEAASELGQVDRFMPVLFNFCHALARQWMAWGVRPEAFLGHSLGEYVAATMAGVFDPGPGLALVTERGALIQRQPAGAMLIVWRSEAAVKEVLFGRLGIAAVNGPELCVVSGPADEIDALEGRLASQGATTRRLQIDHAAHSWMMEGAMEPLAACLGAVPRSRPVLPYVSNVTGKWMTPEDAVDPAYYARHLRQPVRFTEGLATLLEKPGLLLLEVGPGQALSVLARQHPKRSPDQRVVSSLFGIKDDDMASLLLAVGRLWCAGVELDWTAFEGVGEPPPDVPAEWQELARSRPDDTIEVAARGEDHRPREGTEARLAALWTELLQRPAIVDRRQGFFDLGGHSLLAVQLVKKVREVWSVDFSLQTLFATPALAKVAAVIDAAVADRERHPERGRFRSLMAIQGLGSRPPLFVVPGGNGEDGELYVHAGLSEGHYGPEQPVYGFRRRGWDGRGEPQGSVPEMARDYLTELRMIQPRGPYFLHGDCAGGPVAYEMACQLRGQGETVGLLLLTDSLCPRPFELQRYALQAWGRRLRRNPLIALGANLVEWMRLPKAERAAFLERKRDAIRRRFGNSPAVREPAATDGTPTADPVRGGLKARHVGEGEFWTPGGRRYWETIQGYRPRPYAGTVHLIASTERAGMARIRRWKNFAADTRLEVVSGSHWLYLWHHGDRVAARLVESQGG